MKEGRKLGRDHVHNTEKSCFINRTYALQDVILNIFQRTRLSLFLLFFFHVVIEIFILLFSLKTNASPLVMKFSLLHYAPVVSKNSLIKKTTWAIFDCRCFPPPSLILLFSRVSPLRLLFWDCPLLAQHGVRDSCACVCGGLCPGSDMGCH